MALLAELDSLIMLLEATIPANPNAPVNQKLQAKLEKELAKYFRDLAGAFPYERIGRLYNRHVTETIGSESEGTLDPLLASFKRQLEATIRGHLVSIYLSGSAEMVTWGKTMAGVPIAYEGPPSAQAIAWAEKHGAKLVTQMDEETKRRLAQTISDAIKNKRGIPGLGRDLRDAFGDMSRYRSELIARTETANALSQASLDNMKAMGITGKEWVTAGDDRVSPECQGNEAEGVIPVGNMFSGGVMAPPQHPACRCSLAPAMLKK